MKSFSSFIEKLSKNIRGPLPGEETHLPLEAFSAKYLDLKPNKQTRKSAVLILLYPSANEIYFPLIVRSLYDGFHSGEVGFPGGRYELTDEDLIQTALREANEEIGLNTGDVKILGTLTEIFIGPSNFFVLPVVGYLPYRPEFLPDDREVKDVLEVRLDYFLQPNSISSSVINIPGDIVRTPHYTLQDHKIWGATAKMINELLAVLSRDSNVSKI